MKYFFTLLLVSSMVFCVNAQDKMVTINGKVTNLETPVANADVRSEKTGGAVQTNAEGRYELTTTPGDIVTFSYPGLRDMEIIVEDVTSVLNIKLSAAVNQLDEVIVEKTKIKSQNQLRGEYATNKNLINTAFGILDRDITNFSVRIIEGKQLLYGGIDIASAIQYRFGGVRVERLPSNPYNPTIYLRGNSVGFFPAIYDVDGLILEQFPSYIQIENVERIAILSGLGLVTKYGGKANGGVIVINTKGGSTYRDPNTGELYDQALLRNNIYEGNALKKDQVDQNMPQYLKSLYASSSEKEAMDLYEEQSKIYGNSLYYVLDVFGYFNAKWRNAGYADEILTKHWYLFKENPVGLKALAYLYQVLGNYEKARDMLKEVFILRPNYAQSYRDLALSYIDMGEYKKAASLYARYDYLIREKFIRAEDEYFTPLMEREFSNLLELYRKELVGSEGTKGPSLNSDFQGTRLVFEWNDSEAEFELQFVNPQNKFFTWEHSLMANSERIREEKIKGYSCQEYLIDEALQGTWQINSKYFGNKSLTPTYLKATIYYNYGTKAQRHETKVYKLQLKDVNQQLFTVLNSMSLISN
jgi:hypothetical protein